MGVFCTQRAILGDNLYLVETLFERINSDKRMISPSLNIEIRLILGYNMQLSRLQPELFTVLLGFAYDFYHLTTQRNSSAAGVHRMSTL
jgi:hypothetical protein